MAKQCCPKRGSSALEYMTLIVFVIAVFLVMGHYVLNGLSGRWKATGDAFSQGHQYDPRPFGAYGTLDCMRFHSNAPAKDAWIPENCYDQQCAQKCMAAPSSASDEYTTDCISCVDKCKNDSFAGHVYDSDKCQ